MSMKWFKILGIVTGMATQVAGEVVQALADGVLDGPELGNLIKKGILGLSMAGVSQEELDQIQMVTTRAEYDVLEFKDGDVLVYGPVELTSKLKIKV
jgi:hypothetical protein